MSKSVALSGADTILIDDRILVNLADGDCVHITFPNDITTVKAGKDGNMIYAFNQMGKVTMASLRVLLGSDDDKFLTALLQEMENDFSGFTLMTGSFSKRVGDGAGNISTVVYQMSGGTFKKQQEAKTSAEGDAEQSVVVYEITFGNGDKSIQ